LGISIGAEFAEKIFRPFPEYTSDSVTSIASIRNVGSSCAEVVPRFFAAFPEVAPVFLAEAAVAGAVSTGAVTAAGATTGRGLSSFSSKYKIVAATKTNAAINPPFFRWSAVSRIIAGLPQ
jgi:hypothetical protein